MLYEFRVFCESPPYLVLNQISITQTSQILFLHIFHYYMSYVVFSKFRKLRIAILNFVLVDDLSETCTIICKRISLSISLHLPNLLPKYFKPFLIRFNKVFTKLLHRYRPLHIFRIRQEKVVHQIVVKRCKFTPGQSLLRILHCFSATNRSANRRQCTTIELT